MIALINSLGLHGARVRPVVGLSEPEAADEFTCGEARNQVIFESLVRICVDGVHHEGGLHRKRRTIA